jgi:nucleoside-diphosphate-sugar epimerase
MRLLLTGATGFVGGAVAAALAARDLLATTVFLVRATSPADGARRVAANLARFGVEAAITPDQIVLGDLTQPDAFAAAPGLDGLSQVIHCAALATFSTNPAIWSHNVDGTLALARAVHARSPGLQRWVQVGTAMCCGPGLRSPVVESWEAGRDEAAHLVPYTRSKIAAELALRELPGFPLVVARPSIVVGHSRLGCAPSPSIFWVLRMAFALERFTCAPEERIDIIPSDWCADALVTLALAPRLSHDLYHLAAGGRSNRFDEIDVAYAAACGREAVLPRYQQVAVDELRSLVPLFEQRLGRVNRLLILRALTLYGAFAQLNYVFDNQRLLAEGVPPPPPFADYIAACVRSSAHVPMTEQMAADFK